jgi:SSS family solute:Na+ symporter
VRPGATEAEESQVAKIFSLFVKLGALGFIIFLPTEYAIDLQLLGGVWILQTLPAVVIALYTRWFHRTALLAGWAAGMAVGTFAAATNEFKSVVVIDILGVHLNAYAALLALVVNLVVATALTLALRRAGADEGEDETADDDYEEIDPDRTEEGRLNQAEGSDGSATPDPPRSRTPG